jgi:hypothetical protein
LEYFVTDPRVPFRSEYLEVVELTRQYLADFFRARFDSIDLSELQEFLTIFTGSDVGQPVLIEYESTAVFEPNSVVIPEVEVLDSMLSEAFVGDNLLGFVGMLQSLPPSNVFSTTTFVSQTDGGVMAVSSNPNKRKAGNTGNTMPGVIAGAAGILFLATGLVIYKRRQAIEESEESSVEKNSGSVTLAETYTSAWSLDQESETQPFRSYKESEDIPVVFEEDEDNGHDSEDDDTCTHTDNEIEDIAMRWQGMNSISLS